MMQDLRIYLTIENPATKQTVNIRGDFDIFRSFLAGVGTLEIHEQPTIPPAPVLEPAQV